VLPEAADSLPVTAPSDEPGPLPDRRMESDELSGHSAAIALPACCSVNLDLL
jgi:hypothetical protein